jgi:hypothetical protein
MATVQFERHPHDREHPYSIISNELIRHPTLSLDTIALLIRMLSLPAGWRMTEASLRSYQRDVPIGDTVMRRMIGELRDHGYLEKVTLRDEFGRVTEWRWYVRENPSQQKKTGSKGVFSQNVGNPPSGSECVSGQKTGSKGVFSQNVGNPHCGQPTAFISTEEKKELKKEVSLLSDVCDADETESNFLTEEFFEHLTGHHPGMKLPDRRRSQAAIERMVRLDKRAVVDVRKVIEFLGQDDFWCSVVLSGEKLRKNFDALVARIEQAKKSDALTQNRLLANEAKRCGAPLVVEGRWVRHATKPGKDLSMEMNHDAFAVALRAMVHG